VSANTGAARSGTLTIGGKTFTVSQAAAPSPACTYSIAPANQTIAVGGGGGSVAVTTGADCAWTATSSAAWLTVASGASGTGTGSVVFTVSANATGVARSATIAVNGQTFTVNQDGS
jgi:hypothetical protein